MERYTTRDHRQKMLQKWAIDDFGESEATNIEQRSIRLLEEALEAYQAAGGHIDMAHKLVDYVFSRPVGDLNQETGGVGVTLLLLCEAANLSADEEEAREVDRIFDKAKDGGFRKRNEAKNSVGFRARSL